MNSHTVRPPSRTALAALSNETAQVIPREGGEGYVQVGSLLESDRHAAGHRPEAARLCPLVVDLDGTLVRSDLLIEIAFRRLGQRPTSIFGMIAALRKGKAALKHFLCDTQDFDPSLLPYDDEVLAMIEDARFAGRPVYLASASHERLVAAIAGHLQLFDGYFATDASSNMTGAVKADRLVRAFGERGFDYVGNESADLPVWAHARRAIAIRTSGRVAYRLGRLAPETEFLDHERPTWTKWAKLFRVHQYAKNGLIFVPLIAAHSFDPYSILTALIAAVAFCLCASATYILNDLFDLRDDRQHLFKKNRPLASGEIPLLDALVAVPLLILVAHGLAASISIAFASVLAGYFALATLYSLYLKRLLLIDVLTLAGLYTVRIVAGGVAIGVPLSIWLLAFSLSIFLSLALLKRFIELRARADADLPSPSNRDYEKGDLGILQALAAAAGFNAITVLALYVSSDAVHPHYDRPELLWLSCPILAYWISRALILAQRRQIQDDPVSFALKDRQSYIIAAALMMLFVAAS